MNWKRSVVLTVLASAAGALFAWNHVQHKVHAVPEVQSELTLTGVILPKITTPIRSGNLNLIVPWNTWVTQGEVIGSAEADVAPGVLNRARQELDEDVAVEAEAREQVLQLDEELNTLRAQESETNAQEALDRTAALDAQSDFERREGLFKSALTSNLDYDEATQVRDSADAVLNSVRSNRSTIAMRIEESEAKTEAVRARLADAIGRRNSAEAVYEHLQGRPDSEPVIAPADGMLVQSETDFGIASDPAQLQAYAMVRQADLMSVAVGQPAQIVLDTLPVVTLKAKVSVISESPIQTPQGMAYQVSFEVDNPGDMKLARGEMKVQLANTHGVNR